MKPTHALLTCIAAVVASLMGMLVIAIPLGRPASDTCRPARRAESKATATAGQRLATSATTVGRGILLAATLPQRHTNLFAANASGFAWPAGRLADRLVWNGWPMQPDGIVNADAVRGITAALPSHRNITSNAPLSNRDLPKINAGQHRPVRVLFIVTAYCPCRKCCGKWAKYGRTAFGLPITFNGGHFVAADTRVLPFMSTVRVPGYADGKPVPVIDRGRNLKGYRIDVFMPNHRLAKQWGVRKLWVEVVELAGSSP